MGRRYERVEISIAMPAYTGMSCRTKEEWFRYFEYELTEYYYDLALMRRETLEEARDYKTELLDPETGTTYKDPMVIPFRKTDDGNRMQEQRSEAMALIQELHSMLKLRKLTPVMMYKWGLLQSAYASVMASTYSTSDDLSDERKGIAGGASVALWPQKKWVAHLLVWLLEKGCQRKQAYFKIAQMTDGLIREKLYCERFPEGWYLAILSTERPDGKAKLTSTCSYNFKPSEIKHLIARQDIPIPPLRLERFQT